VNQYQGQVLQEQNYYPFGLTVNEGQSATTLPNKYLYQGNKMQDEDGLDLYDFHARQYDPQIGRFWGADRFRVDIRVWGMIRAIM
jgi:RHS repeat-associated protein